jgi:urease accessory protein
MTRALADGLIDLAFGLDASGRTRLLSRRQRYPLQITTALPGDHIVPGMASIIIQSPSGGLFPGDDVYIRIRAEPGARVRVTTASATKIYGIGDETARQTVDIEAAPGAFVEYTPSLLIPHPESSYAQECRLLVHDGAAIVATEQVSPGRFARGEAFAYRRMSLRTSVLDPSGRLLAADRMVIEPSAQEAQPILLGGYPYLGTVAVASPRDSTGLATRLDQALADSGTGLAGAGPLPHNAGVLARVLAPSSRELWHAVRLACTAARRELLDPAHPERTPPESDRSPGSSVIQG